MSGTKSIPTAFAHEARLRIFQPTRRPSAPQQVARIATSHGHISIEHRAVQRGAGDSFDVRALGQAHADLLDAMRATALHAATDGAGRLVMLVDPAKAKRAGGFKCSTAALRMLLDDMLGAVIEIHEPQHLRARGHLIDTVRIAEAGDGEAIALPCNLSRTQKHASRGARYLWAVTMGDVGMQLIARDMGLHYPLDKVVSLQTGISQAVARWMLGHSRAHQPNGGWFVDTVINAVSGPISGEDLRNRRRELRRDAAALAEMGILLNADRVVLT